MKLNKTPIAVAVLAACGAMPLAANAAPTVSWTTPSNGAVLRGNVADAACAVQTSSDTQRVTFWADSWQINNDYSAPFNCNFPTTQLSDGPYKLRAVAYDAAGNSTEADISININNNGGTVTPTPTATPTPTVTPTSSITTTPIVTTATATVAGPIKPADILGKATGNLPFSQQSGWGGQVLGQYPSAQQIPETGINGTLLPNGETLRLGKQADPADATKQALAFQLAPSDPMTSGS